MEGIHPRRFVFVSDAGVERMVMLCRWIQLACDLPKEQRSMLIRLLDKDMGGWRPIALLRT